MPIAVIANGTGPTVIIEGGNHGDEYEGPITIGELIRELDPGEVQGRLILMPANNVHAVMAGRRTSPVDGLNFNRSFPGNPHGTITEQISAYVTDHIFTIGDAFLDLHSGGSSLDILPSAIVEPTDDPDLRRRNIAAVQAFGAPLTVVISNLGEPRTATAAACRAGLVTVGTEMAGGGRVSLDALAICRRGVRNVLAHLGVLDARHAQARKSARHDPRAARDEVLTSSRPVTASFEPFHREWHGGQGRSAGRANSLHLGSGPRTGGTPLPSRMASFTAVRQPGRVKPGNCCTVVASRATAGKIDDRDRRHRGGAHSHRATYVRRTPVMRLTGAKDALPVAAQVSPQARVPAGDGLLQGARSDEPPARRSGTGFERTASSLLPVAITALLSRAPLTRRIQRPQSFSRPMCHHAKRGQDGALGSTRPRLWRCVGRGERCSA